MATLRDVIRYLVPARDPVSASRLLALVFLGEVFSWPRQQLLIPGLAWYAQSDDGADLEAREFISTLATDFFLEFQFTPLRADVRRRSAAPLPMPSLTASDREVLDTVLAMTAPCSDPEVLTLVRAHRLPQF